jgi:hypothetical protein
MWVADAVRVAVVARRVSVASPRAARRENDPKTTLTTT